MAITNPSIRKDRSSRDANNVNVVGTVRTVTGLQVEESGFGVVRQTLFILTAMPLPGIPVAGADQFVSQQLYDFPAGRITVLDCTTSLTFTTTTALATSLVSGASVTYGIGSVAASTIILATTVLDLMPGSGESAPTFTSSTTVNVAPATVKGFLASVAAAQLGAKLNGTVTAADIFLNVSVLVDGSVVTNPGVLTVTGTVLVTWLNGGDV